MATNVHVERYPSRYYWGRTPTTIPKNLSRLISKPIRLPWTNSIPKIVDDEYFWTKGKKLNNESSAKNSGYKTKLF